MYVVRNPHQNLTSLYYTDLPQLASSMLLNATVSTVNDECFYAVVHRLRPFYETFQREKRFNRIKLT